MQQAAHHVSVSSSLEAFLEEAADRSVRTSSRTADRRCSCSQSSESINMRGHRRMNITPICYCKVGKPHSHSSTMACGMPPLIGLAYT